MTAAVFHWEDLCNLQILASVFWETVIISKVLCVLVVTHTKSLFRELLVASSGARLLKFIWADAYLKVHAGQEDKTAQFVDTYFTVDLIMIVNTVSILLVKRSSCLSRQKLQMLTQKLYPQKITLTIVDETYL